MALVLLPIAVGAVLLGIDRAAGGALFGERRLVGLIRVDDVIYSSERCAKQLKQLADDPQVAGVVLRLNSPGGAVAPSQEIYQAVLRFRQSGKPLVASMDNVAASGAYYVASAADRVFANPGSITGSIGVIMRLSRIRKLFDKVGLEMETIKTGEFKDIGSPHRDMTARERQLLQDLIGDTYEQFIADVASGRGMEVDSVRALADGRVFTGRQALQVGLVDTLGGLEDALQYVRETAGLSADAEVYEKRSRVPSWLDLIPEDLLGGAKGLLGRELVPGGIYYLTEQW
jgi:protease-4